jgi:hypothetical protein
MTVAMFSDNSAWQCGILALAPPGPEMPFLATFLALAQSKG